MKIRMQRNWYINEQILYAKQEQKPERPSNHPDTNDVTYRVNDRQMPLFVMLVVDGAAVKARSHHYGLLKVKVKFVRIQC